MHPSACESFHIVWILIILGTYAQLYACLISSFQWKQNTEASYLVCPREAISITHAHSVSYCGVLCSKEINCTAFTYVPTSGTNCYIMATGPPYYTPSCITTASATHFNKVHDPFSCHPDDDMYHTIMLADGKSFSYRIVQSTTSDAVTARTDCESTNNGFLAKLNSAARIQMMQYLMQTCPGFGLNYYYVDGSNSDAFNYNAEDAWTWSDGKQITRNSTFWGSGKPNAEHSEHCIVIGSNSDWKMNDAGCSFLAYYICEKP